VELARQLLRAARLDEIWFVVSPRNPLKSREELLDDDIRLRMVRMALQDEPRLMASDYEFGMPRPSYMWHTLQSMSKDYPDKEFVLLIGADNWACFDRWFAWQEILAHYPVVVYPRGGSPVDIPPLPACVEDKREDEAPAPLPCVRLADTQFLDVSSTEIRRRIKSGQPFAHLVPPAVGSFILSEGLYE